MGAPIESKEETTDKINEKVASAALGYFDDWSETDDEQIKVWICVDIKGNGKHCVFSFACHTAVFQMDSNAILFDSQNIYVTGKNSNTITEVDKVEQSTGQTKCVP